MGHRWDNLKEKLLDFELKTKINECFYKGVQFRRLVEEYNLAAPIRSNIKENHVSLSSFPLVSGLISFLNMS